MKRNLYRMDLAIESTIVNTDMCVGYVSASKSEIDDIIKSATEGFAEGAMQKIEELDKVNISIIEAKKLKTGFVLKVNIAEQIAKLTFKISKVKEFFIDFSE